MRFQDLVDSFGEKPAAVLFDVGVGVLAGDVAFAAVFLVQEFLLIPGAGSVVAVNHNRASRGEEPDK